MRPYQVADVYNATRDKALHEWMSALEAEINRLREVVRVGFAAQERADYQAIEMLKAENLRLRRIEKAAREHADFCAGSRRLRAALEEKP